MLKRLIASADYYLNKRPLYVAPRGAQDYRKAHAQRREALADAGRLLIERMKLNLDSDMLGAGVTDYAALYGYVTQRRPARVLELGTGITTAVMAAAMEEIGHGKLVTVDHIQQYSNEGRALLSNPQKARVDFVVAAVVTEEFKGSTALHYRDVPAMDYDMIFVDGPPVIFGRTQYPSTDAMHVVARSDRPIDIIVDRRLQTLNHYSLWLDCDVVFDAALSLGVIASVDKTKLRASPRRKPSLLLANALDALRLSA
jgi:hypothetical protein